MAGANDNSGVIALLGLAVLAGGAVLASKGKDAGYQQVSGLGDLGEAPASQLLSKLMVDIRTGYDKGTGGKAPAKPKVTALALRDVIVVPDEDVSVEPEEGR